MSAFFTCGECTCEHAPGEHSYGGCYVCMCTLKEKKKKSHQYDIGCKNECPCEAGWEE